MLAPLKPFFHGDLAQYGESLQLLDRQCARPSVGQWLLDPHNLEVALLQHSQTLNGASERKAVASDWHLRYLIALLPPVFVLSSLLRYCLPASSRDMVLTLNEAGIPASFAIAHLGEVIPDADTVTRYDALLWQHLDPLIVHLVRQTKVPSKILWGNVRRSLLGLLDRALPLVSTNAALSERLIEDRRALLESPLWTGGRHNPLFMRHRQVSVQDLDGEGLRTLHARCCLAYQLPRTGYCGACPLAPKYRKRVNHDSAHIAAEPIPRGSITE